MFNINHVNDIIRLIQMASNIDLHGEEEFEKEIESNEEYDLVFIYHKPKKKLHKHHYDATILIKEYFSKMEYSDSYEIEIYKDHFTLLHTMLEDDDCGHEYSSYIGSILVTKYFEIYNCNFDDEHLSNFEELLIKVSNYVKSHNSADIKAKTELVKELRNRTGRGMMDCKRALCETEWNIEKAIDLLLKHSLF